MSEFNAGDRVYVPSIRLGVSAAQNATVVGVTYGSGAMLEYLVRMDDEPSTSEPWHVRWYDVEPGTETNRPASIGPAS